MRLMASRYACSACSVVGLQALQIGEVVQPLRQCHRLGIRHAALHRQRALQQRLRLAVQAEAGVDRAERLQQPRLDRRLLGQLRIDAHLGLVQHLARRHRAAARLARVGEAEQADEKVRGLLGRVGLLFGTRGLLLRDGALDERVGGESGRQHHAAGGRARRDEQAAVAALLLAPAQQVEADPQHRGDEFQLGPALAVLAWPRIGGDRLGGCVAESCRRAPRWKRSAGGKHSSDSRPGSDEALGSPPTISGKMRSSRPRRLNASISSFTQRDRAASGEQITIWQAESRSAALMTAPSSVALASSSRSRNIGIRRFGTDSGRGGRADQRLWRPVGLERPVQPVCPLGIPVAVAQEGPVLHAHGSSPLSGETARGSPAADGPRPDSKPRDPRCQRLRRRNARAASSRSRRP